MLILLIVFFFQTVEHTSVITQLFYFNHLGLRKIFLKHNVFFPHLLEQTKADIYNVAFSWSLWIIIIF